MREGENDRQNNNKSKERQISRRSAVSILAAVAGGTNNGTELVKRERVWLLVSWLGELSIECAAIQ